jgi:hypothetical protein
MRKSKMTVKMTATVNPRPDNEDGGLSYQQKDTIRAMIRQWGWTAEHGAQIAKTLKLPEEAVRQFLAPSQQRPSPKPQADKKLDHVVKAMYPGQMSTRLNDPDRLEEYYAARFELAWRRSVDSIIEAGKVLAEAKDRLPRSRFEPWVEKRLGWTRQSANRLIAVATDARIGTHGFQMPSSWRTLYDITRLDDAEFDRLLNEGTINPEMKRKDLKRGPKKPLPKPIIPGDLADRMKIIQGNCLDVLPTITRPHFRISDPIYNIGMRYDGYDDDMAEAEYQKMLVEIFKGHPTVIILDPEKAFNLLGGGILGRCQKLVAWVYNSNLPNQFRLVMWFNCKPDFSRLGQPYKNPNDQRIAKLIAEGHEARLYDVWYINIVNNVSKDFDHPCPIPVELARRIILVTTNPGDLVVDPFCGSGTIPAVAAAFGREGIGIEQSEKYCEIARARRGTIIDELKDKGRTDTVAASELPHISALVFLDTLRKTNSWNRVRGKTELLQAAE